MIANIGIASVLVNRLLHLHDQ